MNTGPSPLLTTIIPTVVLYGHSSIGTYFCLPCTDLLLAWKLFSGDTKHPPPLCWLWARSRRSLSNGQESCAHLCRASGESVCLASSQPFLNNFPALNTWLSHSGNVPDLQLLLKLWHQLSYTCTDSPWRSRFQWTWTALGGVTPPDFDMLSDTVPQSRTFRSCCWAISSCLQSSRSPPASTQQSRVVARFLLPSKLYLSSFHCSFIISVALAPSCLPPGFPSPWALLEMIFLHGAFDSHLYSRPIHTSRHPHSS